MVGAREDLGEDLALEIVERRAASGRSSDSGPAATAATSSRGRDIGASRSSPDGAVSLTESGA